jgi:hypothetical protein
VRAANTQTCAAAVRAPAHTVPTLFARGHFVLSRCTVRAKQSTRRKPRRWQRSTRPRPPQMRQRLQPQMPPRQPRTPRARQHHRKHHLMETRAQSNRRSAIRAAYDAPHSRRFHAARGCLYRGVHIVHDFNPRAHKHTTHSHQQRDHRVHRPQLPHKVPQRRPLLRQPLCQQRPSQLLLARWESSIFHHLASAASAQVPAHSRPTIATCHTAASAQVPAHSRPTIATCHTPT